MRRTGEHGSPTGIAALHRRLLRRLGDTHVLEHRRMDCLGEALWRAQRDNVFPDEGACLNCLRRLMRV
ncbi:MAG: DUF1841 family protein [Chromatiales bacterium]